MEWWCHQCSAHFLAAEDVTAEHVACTTCGGSFVEIAPPPPSQRPPSPGPLADDEEDYYEEEEEEEGDGYDDADEDVDPAELDELFFNYAFFEAQEAGREDAPPAGASDAMLESLPAVELTASDVRPPIPTIATSRRVALRQGTRFTAVVPH